MADQKIKDIIHKRNEHFMATYDRKDSNGMAELYTEEGQLLPPNGDFVRGKQALREFWQSIMDMGIVSIRLETGEVEQHGDTAIEVSKGSLFVDGNEPADEVKYIVIWKRENGDWKLHRDIFNSSMPVQV